MLAFAGRVADRCCTDKYGFKVDLVDSLEKYKLLRIKLEDSRKGCCHVRLVRNNIESTVYTTELITQTKGAKGAKSAKSATAIFTSMKDADINAKAPFQ